jgi:hypothetical protein
MILSKRKSNSWLRDMPGTKVTQNNGTRRPWRNRNRILHHQKLHQLQCCIPHSLSNPVRPPPVDGTCRSHNVGSSSRPTRRLFQKDEPMEETSYRHVRGRGVMITGMVSRKSLFRDIRLKIERITPTRHSRWPVHCPCLFATSWTTKGSEFDSQ